MDGDKKASDQQATDVKIGVEGIPVKVEYGTPLEEITDIKQLRHLVGLLYQLLDDISTADDMAKDSNAVYRNLVQRIQRKKNNAIESDGYKLFVVKGYSPLIINLNHMQYILDEIKEADIAKGKQPCE